jgi:hypothetical protein
MMTIACLSIDNFSFMLLLSEIKDIEKGKKRKKELEKM